MKPQSESGWLARRAQIIATRAPDFLIGDPDAPYIRRWWVIPRNRWFNIYLHEILRSDDDRALHDHPWVNLSIIIDGSYVEHTIAKGGIERSVVRRAGSWTFRRPTAAHRLEITDGPAWSLFITGPRVRNWGFHCPRAGWVMWELFCATGNKGQVGRGCGETQ